MSEHTTTTEETALVLPGRWKSPPVQALLQDWEQRFFTRRQPYARQQVDGSYRWVFRRCDRSALASHFTGDETLALSSLDELGHCRWVCLDADAVDGVAQLRLVRRALAEVQLPSHLEASRRGGHLWLFFTLAQPATRACGVVHAVLEQLYTAGALPTPLEVYPDATMAGRLGHAVRMPLGVHQRTGQRYPFLDATGTPLPLVDLVESMTAILALPTITSEQLRAAARQLNVTTAVPPGDRAQRPSAHGDVPAWGILPCTTTTSEVIRWVDAQVGLPDLLEELVPQTELFHTGQGYLGWCPFHDDRAADADGLPGTPSFYVVHNERYGWSWRCLSTNCPHADGPMRHTFRLFQDVLGLDVRGAIQAAQIRWADAQLSGITLEGGSDADAPTPR